MFYRVLGRSNLIIGLPYIFYCDLLPFFQSHMSRHTSCEMCAVQPLYLEFNSPVAQICTVTDLTLLNVNEPQRFPNPCKIYIPSILTDTDFDNDIRPPLAQQHLTYGEIGICVRCRGRRAILPYSVTS